MKIIEVINRLIDDSTWSTIDTNEVYKFENGKDVCINENVRYEYVLNYSNNRIVILLGESKKYYVNYINDFTIELYNTKEKFRLMPASA
jgi:hypothetical protein